MNQKRRLSPGLLIAGWIVCLAIVGLAVHFVGPNPSKIALLSVSDGMSMTFGSIYLLGIAGAVFLTLAVVHWAVGGSESIFELCGPARLQEERGTGVIARTVVIGAYALVALLTCYFIYVRLDKTLLCTMANDTFVYFDAAHRLAHGQRQHIDFHTPIGIFGSLLPYWGLKAANGFAGSMEWASLIGGALLLSVGVPAIASRLTVAPAIPLVVYLCFLAVVPLGVETTPDKVTTAMYYNRLGWTATTLVFLFFIEPRVRSKSMLALDCVCLSALLFFLLYLKITYFVVCTAFLPLLYISSRYNRRLSLFSFVLVVIAVGIMEYLYGLNGPYLHDLTMAIQASGANRGSMLPKLFLNIREFALVACVVALTWERNNPKWLYLAYVAFVSLAGLAIIDQNTHPNGVICLLSALVVSHELIRRDINDPSASDVAIERRRLKSLACLGLIVLSVIQPLVFRGTSMAMINSAVTQVKVDLPGGLNGMIFVEHLWKHFCAGRVRDPHTDKVIPSYSSRLIDQPTGPVSGSSYLDSVLDGVRVLEDAGTSGKSVFVFDFVNPFSFILSMEPPRGGHTCIHYGRTMSDDVFPPPDDLLGSVDYVMIPRLPRVPATTEFLVKTYGPYLKSHFDEATTTDFWVLWTRREPAHAD